MIMMNMAAKFLEELRQACGERGGQKALVAATGVSQPTLSRILNGGSEPALKTVSLLADALGLELVRKNNRSTPSGEGDMRLEEANRHIASLEREIEGLRREMQGMDRALSLLSGNGSAVGKYQTIEKNSGEYEPRLPERDVG